MLKELLEKTRSYRRFDENRAISDADMRAIASAVRLCPSAANLQRVRVALVNGAEENESVFKTLSFAAYLKDWEGPAVGERPTAYAVLMTERDPDVNLGIDIGIASEAMLLTAREMGIGGCIFRSFKPEVLSDILGKDGYVPVLVIAFGYPSEEVVIEDVKDGNIRYYRDGAGVHHVPKLPLDEIII